jgi:hypothetical protein
MEIIGGHASPLAAPSAQAAGLVASIKSEDTCLGALVRVVHTGLVAWRLNAGREFRLAWT